MTDERTLTETDIRHAVEISQFGKKNVILDSQILTTLMACERLMDFRFNHNLVAIAGKSNSLECGSMVHVFMEYFYGNIIKGLPRDKAFQYGIAAAELYVRGCPTCTNYIPIACDICKDGQVEIQDDLTTAWIPCSKCGGKGNIIKPPCGHKINEFPGLKNTPRDSEDYKTGWQWVLDTCDQYYNFYRNDHWVPLEVEVVKGEILYEDDEIRVLWKAKLDWTADTNQGIYPIDHKTMKQRRDTISMNNQFIGQCIIMKTRGIFINKIGFQTSLKPEEKFTRIIIPYSESRLLEWQSETLPYYSKLLLMYTESGHFPPRFTHCEGKYGTCAFLKVCESNPDMREEEIKKTFFVGPEWNPSNEDD